MEYITLTELLLIIGSFIAFADLLLNFFNDNDKNKKQPPSDQTVGGYSTYWKGATVIGALR